MTSPDEQGLNAVLLQLSDHRGRLGEIGSDLTRIDSSLAGVQAELEKMRRVLASQGNAILAQKTSGKQADDEYVAEPSVRWWDLTGEERDSIVKRIREWIETVYQPHYGYLAAKLPDCWEQHPLALSHLDWLSELHRYLWHECDRTAQLLNSQAEFSIRIVPAVADVLAKETSTCRHGTAAVNGSRWSRALWN